DLYVLFHPGKQVEILVSAHEPGTPGWAGREKLGPLEACVARLGEKECLKSFPKYPRDSKEALAERNRKNCQPEALAKTSDPEGNKIACLEMQQECRTSWSIENKRMCEFDYVEEE
ncbi:hypothetical protein, partial [Chitiniphilus shinanonensis]|uniref:hypothetical protein n=1 Tax=Chitiniphilus shinanonensis TaxID=553088 RepID=UPI003340292C